jgi:Peptidase family M1 domain
VKLLRAISCALGLLSLAQAADPSNLQNGRSGAAILAALHQISLDPERTYHVRDLQLARGDIKIYLTEGVLSFVTTVANRRLAAVFTTEGIEAGDAEILVLPPRRSERASLASFTKTPNLDEHFASAVFFFSDDTAQELLNQLEAKQVTRAADLAAQLEPRFNSVVRTVSENIDVRLVEAVLDNHPLAQGFFYGLIGGSNIGSFHVMYEPIDFEPISVGSFSAGPGDERFQLWTSFRPRHAPPHIVPMPREKDYRIETTIHPDLSMSVVAGFNWIADERDGRVVALGLSERLKVESARVDGKPVELLQRDSAELGTIKGGRIFLLILDEPLSPGVPHRIELRYHGAVIRQTPDGSYLVDERTAWFPFTTPTLANFDLTFHCPAQLRLVSTGEPLADEVAAGERTVHRRTQVPESLAGFNLGDYELTAETYGPYRVECYANRSAAAALTDIANQTGDVLKYYTEQWTKLPIRSIAVSPIPGYLGQGFPGLVYLSNVSYMREENRPIELRNPRLNAFFSQLLLPHEVAHQWWGNVVNPANYRAGWIMEAMANDAALQFIAHTQSSTAVQAILQGYRKDLTFETNGKTLEAAGPVDFGVRLRDTANDFVWHAITYEKGTWIMRMLRQRLGDEAFRRMQVRLLEQFATKPITNDDFQAVLSQFMPGGQPDKTLSLFFDTWVYGTGIPKLTLKRTKQRTELDVSDVDEDFTADVPLRCQSKNGSEQVRWVRASAGSNDLEMVRSSETCRLPAWSDFLYSP